MIIKILLIFLISSFRSLMAQSENVGDTYALRLEDSIEVLLLPAIDPPAVHIQGYNYLPTNLRLSETEDKQPEFLFMTYQKGEEQEAIMHWLFTWGLTPKQQKAMDSLVLVKIDSTAQVLGAYAVEADPKYTFTNKSGNQVLMETLEKGIISGGIVPTHVNSKSASSFKLKGEAVKLVTEAIKDENKAKGIYISMGFNYKVLEKGQYGINIAKISRIILELELAVIFHEAKKCKECIVVVE